MSRPSGSLENRRKRAKSLLRDVDATEPKALERVARHHPRFTQAMTERGCTDFRLADAQLVIAREHGFRSWPAMKAALEAPVAPTGWMPLATTPFEAVIELVKTAEFRAGPEAALLAAMRLEGDRGYIRGILEQLERCPWLLQAEHAADWEGFLWEIYFAPDYSERLSDDD